MKSIALLPHDRIENKIFFIRGKKIMLDRDLAKLYEVENKKLNQAVKRNITRFPTDFMFKLSINEFENWKSHFVTSNSDKMGLRKLPYAFTEQGIAMLSSVLNSERAIQVNIQIIRTFTKIRELIASNKDLRDQIEKLEKKYDQQFRVVFDVIKKLLATPLKPSKPIGFNT
ncbi:MAG: ORF6N domain-containing protein [Patescibacteria group bacterium]